MSLADTPRKHSPILVQPDFRFSDQNGVPGIPSFKEVFTELYRVLNIKHFPTHTLLTTNFCIYMLTFVGFLIFLYSYLSLGTLVFTVFNVVILGTIYNTVWYHRYCCHASYEFKSRRFSLAFLWTNPLALMFREEVYAVPHRIHHERTEHSEDPYGPHLGWWGSYLAVELTSRINTDMSEREYELLSSSIAHIGLKLNNYTQFRKTGSMENTIHYLSRAVFAQIFWIYLISSVGGFHYVLAWYSSIFVITSLIRDFNWRGHGGNSRHTKKPGWEFDHRSYALNQRFYGYIGSEWHDNHHKYPTSANNGFLPGQIDIAFNVIQFFHKFGIVQSFIDSSRRFKEEQLHAV